MTCTGCGNSVEQDARFCAACGAALLRPCATCGAELTGGSQFCSGCGTPVDTYEPASDADGIERKVVSALFVDLAGFTASSIHADPEDVALQLEAFHSAVRTAVERHGGRVEKLIGDGVFAVFGAPVAHEDDAERAVRAALHMQDRLVGLSKSQVVSLAARVAVTTGEAVVRLDGTSEDREGVVGDVVNTASRLQQLAPEGGVLVDRRTYAATQDLADYVAREPVTVKGRPEPVHTWVATGVRSRSAVGLEVEEAAAFVGRSDSLKLLIDTYERAVASKARQLVTITGEPGVGKTRLVHEFQRAMDERPDLLWRQGRCLPYGDGISFWALAEVVKAQAGVLDEEPSEALERKILDTAREFFDDGTAASWVGQRLLELLGAATGHSTRDERFSAWRLFLQTLSLRTPLVLVIDDLHWADSALVEFLDGLVEAGGECPMLVVVTARPELYDSHPQWGDGKSHSASIALGPLTAEETAQLVEQIADGTTTELASVAVRRSGGNPLYATELVRMAADREASDAGDGSIPDTIHAVIASRIDLLGAEDKEVLHAASVIGKVFWSSAVADLTGTAVAAVDESLGRLARRELIRRAHRTSMQEDEFSFWHDLVADVAYGQIARKPRRQMHQSVGQWLESRAGERTGELSEVLAHHYTTALDLADALGESDGRLRQLGRHHLFEAGRRSESVDPGRARSFLERSLDLSETAKERAEVLVLLTTIVTNVVGGADAIELGRRALRAAAEASDVALEARAATVLGRSLWAAGEGEEARAKTHHALALAEQIPDGPELSTILSRAVATLFLQGDFARLEVILERALEVGRRHGPPADYLEAVKWAGAFRTEHGDVDQGVRLLREAHQGAIDGGFIQLQLGAAATLATVLYSHGLGAGEALEVCETAIATGHARGLFGSADFLRVALCEILWLIGRWSEIPPQAHYMIDTYGFDSHAGIGGNVWLSRYLVFTKEPDHELSANMLDIGRQSGDHQFIVPELIESIQRLRQADEPEAAMQLVDEFEKATEGRPFFRTEYLLHVALFLEELDAWDVLERLVAGAGEEPGEPRISLARGLLARAGGRVEEARRELDAALDHARRLESPWQEAIVLTQQAAVDLDVGDGDRAGPRLDQAEDLLTIIGGSVFDDLVARERNRL